MNLQTILKRQKNNRHNNFQMEIGYENVEPIAFLYKKFTENSKWYKGSAIFALAPPIEALSRDLAVDWYFVTVAITPKTVDTKKPEASIFITDEMGRYNANGFIMKDDYWDLWECRNVKIEPYNNIQVELKTNPTTDKELYTIYKMMLEKIYPNIKIIIQC